MKNSATAAERSGPEAEEVWRAALVAFDADLRRRAAAEKRRRAYAIDVGQFARWAATQSLLPPTVDVRALRRYAATMTEQGQAPATIARKLAALRGLFRVQIELGERADNPAE